ncbi:MAG: glycosyltransferase [Microbacteriaceae bacterium]
MNITIVSRIYWPEPSAASSFLAAVADELNRRGHRVEVLATRAPRPLESGHRTERIRRWPVARDRNGYVRGYLQYLSFDAPLLLRLLFMRRPDVVFVEPPPTTGVVVRIVCALRRIPYVYDVADIWSDAAVNATSSRTVIRLLRAMERFAMSGARALVTISQPVADRLQQLKMASEVVVTGFGAETDAFIHQPKLASENCFVYGGTFSEVHGAGIFVRAFATFLTSHPDYTLKFIGNGTERDALAALASALGISDSVRFVSPITTSELASELNRAQAALASLNPDSNYEYAFTTKAYSALACGCPVIFAGSGPTTTLFESAPTGLRIGSAVAFDAHEVARAMHSLASSPLTSAQRAQLANWTHGEHSMAAVASRVADVLQGIDLTEGRKNA